MRLALKLSLGCVCCLVLVVSPGLAEMQPWADWSFSDQTALQSLQGEPAKFGQAPKWETQPAAVKFTSNAKGPVPWVIHPKTGDAGLPTEAITMEAWVRVDSARAWAGIMTAVQDNGPHERGLVFGTDGSGTRFNFGIVSEKAKRITYLVAPEPFVIGGWHHVVGVYDGKSQRVYVDGELVAIDTRQQGPITYDPVGPVAIGAYTDRDSIYALDGALGYLAIYDQAMDSDTIAKRHAAGRATYPKSKEQAGWAMDHNVEEWFAYRGNNGRTGYAGVELPRRLRPMWTQHVAPPAPAWPPPAARSFWQNLKSIEPRIVDDQAMHPVVSPAGLLIGSSADDSVTLFDREDGTVLWRFTTDGPVRYAPTVVADRVFFASDDGWVYCVSLDEGSLIWKQRVGPDKPKISGNGRMISPYPVRSGVLVSNGKVFACAGLFPGQGTYAVAFDTETGDRIWERELGNRSPQGYMLIADENLVIPTGRATPFSIKLEDGSDGPNFGGVGGTYAVIVDDQVVSGRGNSNALVGSKAKSGQRVVSFPGEHLAVAPDISYLAHGQGVAAMNRTKAGELNRQLRNLDLRIKADGDADGRLREQRRAIQSQLASCTLWKIETDRVLTIAASKDAVLIGLAGAVEVRDSATGRLRQKLAVDGEARSIAVGLGQVFVTTEKGMVHVFGDGPRVRPTREQARSKPLPQPTRQQVGDWFAQADTAKGFALLIEPSFDQLRAAANYEGFRVVAVCQDRDRRDAMRAALHDLDLYGTRIAIHLAELPSLPYQSETFNLIVDEQALVPEKELNRVAAPGRSVSFRGTASDAMTRRPSLPGAGRWTHQFADLSNSSNGQDRYTHSDLELQWFGGPGPRRMVDRHLRSSPPLAAGGRLFILGENRVIGVDSYNGTELWDTPVPESHRYSMPYDAGYFACRNDAVFIAVDAELWQLDAVTGKVVRKRSLPARIRRGMHWGFVGIDGNTVYGTAFLPTASHTEATRRHIDLSYNTYQPTSTSKAIFRHDMDCERTRWVYQVGSILNTTICIHEGQITFVETRGPKSRADKVGRMKLPDLMADDPWLVALDAETGKVLWERPFEFSATNILYQVASDDQLIFSSSVIASNRDVQYNVMSVSAQDGKEQWRAEHFKNKPGALGHGEQVHHPVILHDKLIAEPYMYNLKTGEKIVPPGEKEGWYVRRPGHSCGTMSGSVSYIFFRANNPTVLDLTRDASPRFRTLAPTRAGCWINILPADGLVLIPEASASCVCHYSLQTSMAFRPPR